MDVSHTIVPRVNRQLTCPRNERRIAGNQRTASLSGYHGASSRIRAPKFCLVFSGHRLSYNGVFRQTSGENKVCSSASFLKFFLWLVVVRAPFWCKNPGCSRTRLFYTRMGCNNQKEKSAPLTRVRMRTGQRLRDRTPAGGVSQPTWGGKKPTRNYSSWTDAHLAVVSRRHLYLSMLVSAHDRTLCGRQTCRPHQNAKRQHRAQAHLSKRWHTRRLLDISPRLKHLLTLRTVAAFFNGEVIPQHRLFLVAALAHQRVYRQVYSGGQCRIDY